MEAMTKRASSAFEALLQSKILRILCALLLACALVPAAASGAQAEDEVTGELYSWTFEYNFDFENYAAPVGCSYEIDIMYRPYFIGDDTPLDEEQSNLEYFTFGSSNENVVTFTKGSYVNEAGEEVPSLLMNCIGAGTATLTFAYDYQGKGEYTATKSYTVNVAEENAINAIELDQDSVALKIFQVDCPFCGVTHVYDRESVEIGYTLTTQKGGTPTSTGKPYCYLFSDEGDFIAGAMARTIEGPLEVWADGVGSGTMTIMASDSTGLVVAEDTLSVTVEAVDVEPIITGADYSMVVGDCTTICGRNSEYGTYPFALNDAADYAMGFGCCEGTYGGWYAWVDSVESSDDTVVKVCTATYEVEGDEYSYYYLEAVAAGTATITMRDALGETHTATVTVTDDSQVSDEVSLTNITLDANELTLVAGGASSALTVNYVPANATNKNVTWSSSNEDVATVDANGNVIPIAAGSSTITVTAEDGGSYAVCYVTVGESVEGIVLDKSEAVIDGIGSVQLTATVTPEGSSGVVWTSSDTSIAVVNDSGLVTSVAPGSAVITAQTEDGTHSAQCVITVRNPIVSAKATPSSVDMIKGDVISVSLEFAGEFDSKITPGFGSRFEGNGTMADSETWLDAEGNEVCRVVKVEDETGYCEELVFTALGTGSGAYVMDVDGWGDVEIPFTVTNPVQSISISETAKTVTVGDSAFALTATVSPSDADDAVIWSSSDSDVAAVSPAGTVTPVAAGTATITATAGGKTVQCVVTVKAKEVAATSSASDFSASVEVVSSAAAEVVEGLLGVAEGSVIELVVEEPENLTEGAAATIEELASSDDVVVAAVIDAYFTVDGDEVYFNTEHSAVITVKLQMTEEMTALGPDTLVVVYVADDGSTEKMPTWVAGDCLCFETTHFSTYAVISELGSAVPGNSSDPQDSAEQTVKSPIAQTGDGLGAAAAGLGAAMLVAAGAAVVARRRMA